MSQKIIITGGLGFIGGHLARRLLNDENSVTIIDKSNDTSDIIDLIDNKKLTIINADLLTDNIDSYFENIDEVYHLAANSDVRLGEHDTKTDFNQNIIVTRKVLEACKKASIKSLIFTSSSVVYGSAKIIPTPENYGPLLPISMYGSSKLAGEALVSSYSSLFNIKSTIVRFANVIGKSKNAHGIIPDFIKKLENNNQKLEILGNGKQKKSYIYIDDCIDGILFAKNNQKNITDVFNIGSSDQLESNDIADIVCDVMNLKNVKTTHTGNKNNGGGWKGDVTNMMLSTKKLRLLGWTPKHNSKEAVILTTKELLKN